jgi:hypothetical protein
MITFKRYLEEELVSESVIKPWSIIKKGASINIVMSLLNTHAKEGWLKAVQNGGMIYRGFDEKPAKADYLIIDSSTGERTSKDSNNLYQLMLSASTEMKEFADRSKSFICSSSKEIAEAYGYPYVMVPFDGTFLTVSEVSDFFDQMITSPIFMDKISDMHKISDFLISAGAKKTSNKFMNVAEIDSQLGKLTPESLMLRWDLFVTRRSLKFKDEKFQKIYDKINPSFDGFLSQEEINNLKTLEPEITAGRFTTSSESLDYVYKLFKSSKNKRFTALSSVIMTPKSTKLSLVKYGEPLKRHIECWFSGKSIVISWPLFSKILSNLKEQGVPIHNSLKVN